MFWIQAFHIKSLLLHNIYIFNVYRLYIHMCKVLTWLNTSKMNIFFEYIFWIQKISSQEIDSEHMQLNQQLGHVIWLRCYYIHN